jgi:hypothetical protein
MDDHFGGCSGIGDPKKGNMIFSIWPQTTDEIRLFNERFIAKFESNKDDRCIEYSFERLKGRFDKQILKIRRLNPHPKNLIKDYITAQLEIYTQRMAQEGPTKWAKELYKGDWDLSKKVIDTSFLLARSWENYIGFLQSKITKERYEPKEFDNLFKDSNTGQKVKDLLETNKFTINGIWNFENFNSTKNKTSLVAMYHVLKPLIKEKFTIKISPVVSILYKEFGIENLIDPRSMRNLPPIKDVDIFKVLFKNLLKE